MRKCKPLLLVLTLTISGAVALVVKLARPAPGTISYHVQRLGYLRSSEAWKWGPKEFRVNSSGLRVPEKVWDYANPRIWKWYLNGRPTLKSQLDELQEHEQALIGLGYFESRELTFAHRTLGAQLWSEWRTAVSNAPLAEPRYIMHLDETRPTMIRVSTCKADIPVFQRIVTQLDSR